MSLRAFMGTDIRCRRQWPKCVGYPICAFEVVSQSFRITASRDRNFAVRPCHRLGQRQRGQAGSPEIETVATAPQLRETAAQDERERRAACMHPMPPAARGMAGNAGAARSVTQRGPSQQVQQNALLLGPWIPAARRDAQRQTRAGTVTGATAEAGDRDRIEHPSGRPVTVGFALVVAMQPGISDTTVGACLRSIHFGRVHDLLNMLG